MVNRTQDSKAGRKENEDSSAVKHPVKSSGQGNRRPFSYQNRVIINASPLNSTDEGVDLNVKLSPANALLVATYAMQVFNHQQQNQHDLVEQSEEDDFERQIQIAMSKNMGRK